MSLDLDAQLEGGSNANSSFPWPVQYFVSLICSVEVIWKSRCRRHTHIHIHVKLIPHREPSSVAFFHQDVDWDDEVACINSPCIR